MEAPPDIRKRSRKESLQDLMTTMKVVRATKAASSGMDFLGKDDFASALGDFVEAAEVFEELGDLPQVSNMLSMQALCLYALGRLDEAEKAMSGAIKIKSACSATEGMATDLLGLGEILIKKGEPDKALEKFQEAESIFKEMGLTDGIERSALAIRKARAALGAVQ